MQNTITLDSKVSQNPQISIIEKNGEYLTHGNNKSSHLSEVGSKIWQLAQNTTTIKDICNKLQQIYDVNQQQCVDETINFIHELKNKDIIKVHQ